MSLRSSTCARAVLSAALALAASGAAPNEVFDARGFNRNREYFFQFPNEQVDPLTGNLVLTFTDLILPGNAGFDLRIQRTYNSKIFRSNQPGTLDEDSWAGIGWTLHLGRVRNPLAGVPGPVEMPDGSSHKLFNHIDGSGRFITKQHWVYDKNQAKLLLTNGLIYTFGRNVTLPSGQQFLYVTRIDDPFGNSVVVTYMTGAGVPSEGIASIVQDLGGGQQRVVTFNAGGPRQSLQSMSFLGRTWTYTMADSNNAGYSLLTRVQPPAGPAWNYGYETVAPVKNELVSMTTPFGATVQYIYSEVSFRIGTTFPTRSRAVTRRTTGGRDVAAGTWTYAYAQGSGQNESVIATPCVTTTHTFLGVGNFSTPGAAWRIGLPSRIVTSAGSTILQDETRTWIPSAPISGDEEIIGLNRDVDIFVPLLSFRRIARGRNYDTTYGYNSGNFNDYARPSTIAEQGELGRTTTRVFQYGFAPSYIVDRVQRETVNVSGNQFTRQYAYNLSNGFLTSEDVYGIAKTFVPGARGNVARSVDALGKWVDFAYAWGVVDDIGTPEFPIFRSINQDGTLASETRRGFTTVFGYDALARPTSVQPPAGNATTTSYTSAFVEDTRGPSRQRTELDGFGRPSGSDDNAGVRTNTNYDACGRRVYESYPFLSPNDIGTSFTLDGLDRVVRKSNPDGTRIDYAFSGGVDVTVTDEAGRTTVLDHSAFGDPGEVRLVGLRDAADQVASYGYNALGSLTAVSFGGVGRTFAYNGRNELVSEAHPESGTTSYSYHPNGVLFRRTDAAFGTTEFGYDGNNRTTVIDRPGSEHDVSIVYDDSDNRTSVTKGGLVNTYAYDEANRMTGRGYRVNGNDFGSGYAYDGNDNLTTLTYPTALQVRYTYDAESRITGVSRVSPSTPLASAFTYHASGAPTQFTAGNGITHALSFDNRYRQRTYQAAGVLGLTYTYDGPGNVTAIADARAGFNQSFGYDSLDRLRSVGGLGAGSYAYDAVGNRTQKVVGTAATSYAYTGQRLTGASGAEPDSAFQYDGNGNQTRNAAGQYTYTPTNLMASAAVAGLTTSYRYDGDDIRRWAFDPTVNRYYLHGPGNQLLTELRQCTGAGVQPVRDYVYAGSRLLAEIGSPAVTVQLDQPASDVAEGQPGGAGGLAPAIVRVLTEDGSALPFPVTVSFATAADSASAGADFVPVSGTLTFAATGAQTVHVQIVNDTLVENEEQFSVVLSQPSCGATLGRDRQVVTILDDDPVVGWETTASEVEESAGTASWRAVLTTRRQVPTTHQVTVQYATANGTATAGADYTERSGTLTFPLGWPSGQMQSISVPITNDKLVEADETFSATLSTPTPGTGTGTLSHTVTILDDDPVVSFAQASTTVDEGIGTVRPTVRVTTRRGVHITHEVVVTPTAVPGTAREGQDYQPPTGTFTFPSGSPSGTPRDFPVAIIDDPNDEPTQSFTLRLSTPDGEVGAPNPIHTVAIVDNDPEPELKISDVTVVEGDGGLLKASLDVRLNVTSEFDVTVDYATADDGAEAGPLGNDYWPRALKLGIPPDTAARTVTVPVIGDWVRESTETFRVLLSNPSHATISGGEGVVTIQDTDVDGFTIADVRVVEGAAASLTVHLTPKPTQTVSIYYETVDETAEGGTDYVTSTGELVFEVGQPSAKLGIPTMADGQVEGLETFRVRLFALSSPPIVRAEAVVTIAPRELGTDFNDDQHTDLLWHHAVSGQVSAWFMDGPVMQGGSALNPNGIPDVGWQVAGTGDFNADASPDLLWRHVGSGELAVWFMNGINLTSGTLTDPPSLPDLNWRLVATGDFDRDGQTDFFWRHQTSGQLVVWFMDGAVLRSGTFTNTPPLTEQAWKVAGLADFSGDGQPDILWRHDTSGQLVAWTMDGIDFVSGEFLDPEALPDASWRPTVTRDMDNDGRPDIVWRHTTTGQLVLWHMYGPTLTYGEFLTPSALPDLNWKMVGPR